MYNQRRFIVTILCILILGLIFAGNTNVRVGQNATISCISDLSVQSMQWVFNDDVVETSNSQQVDLTFSPVFDYLHNREYSCRAITTYGMLERRIIITIESKYVLISHDVKRLMLRIHNIISPLHKSFLIHYSTRKCSESIYNNYW